MKILGELIFVGLGLHDEKGLSLRGVEELKRADAVFAEFYTNLMIGFSVERLEHLVGKKISIVSRRILEDEGGKLILQRAKKGRIVFLVPGDPLIATTHIDLRIRAEKQGIRTRIIHGVSIISAVIGLSGLQNYKFGRSVTISFFEDNLIYETPYRVIMENRKMGLHTLCFLDFRAKVMMHMTIKEALQLLLTTEESKKLGVITPETLVLGIARAGSREPVIKAGYVKDIIGHKFGAPPHSLVFPGRLHFMEAEALITLASLSKHTKLMLK